MKRRPYGIRARATAPQRLNWQLRVTWLRVPCFSWPMDNKSKPRASRKHTVLDRQTVRWYLLLKMPKIDK